MLRPAHPRSATRSQVELVEYALRQVTGVSRSGWGDIPDHLRALFAKYMIEDIWTGASDPLSLSDASLRILRDAITRTGPFAGDEV